MTKTQVKIRIEKLKKEIEHHRYLSHVLDSQEISEAALDSLKHELVKLESQWPEFKTQDSPSQRIGGQALDKFQKVRHSRPVLSLEDYFSFDELEDWQRRNQKLLDQPVKGYYCELKLDGLTVVLTYKNGLLDRGATRGDGYIGEEVTHNLRTIESLPLRLALAKLKNPPAIIEVRGEAVMSKANFDKLNKTQKKGGLAEFANPRNLTAGSIRQLDPKMTAGRRLDLFAFELITDLGQTTHAQSHQLLKQLGFKVSRHDQEVKDLAGVKQYLKQWEKKRKTWDYSTDGAVIVVNDLAQERRLGSVGKSERWMAAFKFPAEQTTTKVKDIIVQVGRTGALTPIAILEPVLVAGSTVSRATLHNEDEIKRLDVRIGDTVIIQKAGDIIPDIVQVLPKLRTGREKKFNFPTKCPICGQPVKRPAGEVAHYCTNKQCYAQEIQGLIHFVSKAGLNIEGLGDKIVEQLVATGLVRTPADFFKLKTSDLEQLERFAEKSAANLVESISAVKKIPLARFIYALGIRHVGQQTAIDLAQEFGSWTKLAAAGLEQLEAAPDVGPVVAKSIHGWLQNSKNQRLVKDLLAQGLVLINPKIERRGGVSGRTFVITGSLSQPREYFEDQIRQAGGRTSGSVSAKTDYVLAGDTPGSKLDKARSLGVKIIGEAEFKRLLK